MSATQAKEMHPSDSASDLSGLKLANSRLYQHVGYKNKSKLLLLFILSQILEALTSDNQKARFALA